MATPYSLLTKSRIDPSLLIFQTSQSASVNVPIYKYIAFIKYLFYIKK